MMTTTSFPFENNSIDKYEISRLGSHLIKRIVLMKYETGSGQSIVRDQFPREKMAIGQGIITSMFAGGAVIGLSIGGFIIQHYGWQTTFFTIIPIAIALLFINWRFLNINQAKTNKQQSKLEKSGESETISDGSI